MTEVVTLDAKEIRIILAKYFGVDEKKIIPTRYSYSISGISADEIKAKMEQPR